eukprot:12556202-Prorocentrum_lima.AAC.1
MTSSLVGSEMCIRDRGTCRAAAQYVPQDAILSEQTAPEAILSVMSLKICLLYTSDAADDM